MTSVSNYISPELLETCTYNRAVSAVFLKTKERFGGLSNMAGEFTLWVNGVEIRTSEALYQACRFPGKSELQKDIIDAKSPMAAKIIAKKQDNTELIRKDWNDVRVEIMRWCLQVKLAWNYEKFRKALIETEGKKIVEESSKDKFWGAKPDGEILKGSNILGKLLMELREKIETHDREMFQIVEPLRIENFKLMGDPIKTVKYKEPPLFQ